MTITQHTEREFEGRRTMELEVLRYSSQNHDTLGLLFSVLDDNRSFLAFTLEDEQRTHKVYAETRIPAGRYRITLRTEGRFHSRYSSKFGFHKGMLWIRDVPGFEYILIHIGNDEDDTAGCLLIGDEALENIGGRGMLKKSTSAYRRVYPLIADALERGEEVWITYIDYDEPPQK